MRGDMAPAVVALVGQVAADAGDDASQRLSMVIIGLLVLAVVITVATVVFWRLTRPEPAARGGGIRWVAAPEGVEPAGPAPAGPAPASPAGVPPVAGDGVPPGVPPAAG
jgi:hypothetical protein